MSNLGFALALTCHMPYTKDMNTNHRIVWDTTTHRNSRTKDEILRERIAFLVREAKAAVDYLDGLEKTNCGLDCGGCGTLLKTEADFAAHFVVRDEAYLNLGNCHHKDN